MKASETLAGSRIASQAAPSPARHGGCKKNRNRRAACPLPQLSGQGSEESSHKTRTAAISSSEESEDSSQTGTAAISWGEDLQTALEQGHQNYIFASGLAYSAVSEKLLLALGARLIDGLARRNRGTCKLDAEVYRHDLIRTMAAIHAFERGHVGVVTSNGDANMALVRAASMGRVESRPTRIRQPGFEPRVTCLLCHHGRVARCYRWSKVA